MKVYHVHKICYVSFNEILEAVADCFVMDSQQSNNKIPADVCQRHSFLTWFQTIVLEYPKIPIKGRTSNNFALKSRKLKK